MPLAPKQQPPYYTPSTQTPGAPLTKVFTTTTSEESATTTVTNVGIYEMPANTLTQDGDVLECTYWGNAYNSPTNINLSLYIATNVIALDSNAGNFAYNIKASIMRATSNTIRYTINLMIADAQQITLQGSLGPIDFTISNTIQLQIQANIDGNIRLSASYINLIK